MDELTDIEKRHAEVMLIGTGGLDAINKPIPSWWPEMVRKSMKCTAYHEAGHFAARMFHGLEASHVVSISIIGDERWAGVMSSERAFTERSLISFPAPLQRSNGRMLLLEMLAGYGTEVIMEPEECWQSILELIELGDHDVDGEGSDFSRAVRIAEIMARPYMPVGRILRLADRWTLEMLRIPEVWALVEKTAAILMKQGTIEGDDLKELADVHWQDDFSTIHKVPTWRRRITFKLDWEG